MAGLWLLLQTMVISGLQNQAQKTDGHAKKRKTGRKFLLVNYLTYSRVSQVIHRAFTG